MRASKFIVAALLLVLIAMPGVSAIQKEKEYEFNLSPSDSKVIVIDDAWKGNVIIDLVADPEVDMYIIEGDMYNGSSVKVRVFENVTDLTTVWSEKGNYSIVIDNLDNPSDTDAPGLETAKITITITWNEDIPADPFLTAFCCGIVLIAVVILFYIFIRFFLRKPPKAQVQQVRPGTVERMPGPKDDAAPRKRRTKPPAPVIRSKTPAGPKWPPEGGDGPEQGS